MPNTRLRYTRPSRAYDGEGTLEALGTEVLTLWADPIASESKTGISVNEAEDIRVGDIVEVPSSFFTH